MVAKFHRSFAIEGTWTTFWIHIINVLMVLNTMKSYCGSGIAMTVNTLQLPSGQNVHLEGVPCFQGFLPIGQNDPLGCTGTGCDDNASLCKPCSAGYQCARKQLLSSCMQGSLKAMCTPPIPIATST